MSYRWPTYKLFSSTEVLGRLALERMLGGLSTRRYSLGLEPVGSQVEQAASGTSKSAISWRFVAMIHTALAELLTRDLSALDLVCLMIDGVHFGEHTCVAALDIAIDGTKHRLALVEGATENAALARELLVGLREHGLDVTRPVLCVIDGAKAPRHPRRLRSPGHRQVPAAQDPQGPRPAAPAAARAGGASHARRLARRVRAGRLPARCTPRTPVGSIRICREHASNVKRWPDGQMAALVRAGMVEVAKQFRRVNSYLYLPALLMWERLSRWDASLRPPW